jgi:hypothetical protein
MMKVSTKFRIPWNKLIMSFMEYLNGLFVLIKNLLLLPKLSEKKCYRSVMLYKSLLLF